MFGLNKLASGRELTIEGDPYRIVRAIGKGSCGESFLARPVDELLPSSRATDSKGMVVKHIGRGREYIYEKALHAFEVLQQVNGAVADVLSVYHDGALLRRRKLACTRYVPGTLMPEWTHGLTSNQESTQEHKVKMACKLTKQLIHCVGVLIKYGIVHLDVKEENLIVNDDRVVLIDPDFLQYVNDGKLVDNNGEPCVVGTPATMSPEIARAQEPSSTSDMYSAGCVAAELINAISQVGFYPDYDRFNFFPRYGTWPEYINKKAERRFFGTEDAKRLRTARHQMPEEVQLDTRALIELTISLLNDDPQARPQSEEEAMGIFDYHRTRLMDC